MDSNKSTFKVNIFGTDYPLKVNADVKYVQRVANYVDKKMKEVQAGKPNRPLYQIAILTALNITDELLKQKESNNSNTDNIGERLQNLARKLELGIKENTEEIREETD